MLNPEEKKRKAELMEKYRRYSTLPYGEAQELQELIKRDSEMDDATKLLVLLGIGVLIAYLLQKK